MDLLEPTGVAFALIALIAGAAIVGVIVTEPTPDPVVVTVVNPVDAAYDCSDHDCSDQHSYEWPCTWAPGTGRAWRDDWAAYGREVDARRSWSFAPTLIGEPV